MITLFDFDGVLGSAFEEALFTMDTDPIADRHFISRASKRYDFSAPGESDRSLRYMLLQRMMWDMGDNIHTGPHFDHGQDVRDCMIITARCDLYAVKRMMAFVDFHNLRPSRVFTVGSGNKADTIQMLTKHLPEEQFEFFDDNQKHVDNVIALNHPRVSAFKVDNDMDVMYEKAIHYYKTKILSQF